VATIGSTVARAQVISTDQPQAPPTQTTTPARIQPQVASTCSQLIGACVQNSDGEKLGKIADVVVTFDNEKVSYCILNVKHGIFARSKCSAVPLASLLPSDDGTCLILNATKDNLPPPPDTTPAPIGAPAAGKCSQLIGDQVENAQGEKLGEITDVVVTFGNERVSYCVLGVKHGIGFDQGMFTRTRYLSVPLAAFRPSDDGKILILNANQDNLAQAGGFDRNEWPLMTPPAWGADPEAPIALPPVEVFAPRPIVLPADPKPYPLVSDPTFGPVPVRQTASDAIDRLQFADLNGYFVR
jgi:sporulation protein YlmC with PRC-barrel domain